MNVAIVCTVFIGVNIVILIIRAGEYDWVVCMCVCTRAHARVCVCTMCFSPKSERGV